MKAAQFGEFGDPSVMVVNEVEKPVAGPWQVLVEVKAASINPFDDKLRSGMYGHKWQLPMTAGGDMAGVVAAVGDGVAGVKSGDKVYGQAAAVAGNSGALAEFAVTKQDQVAIMPGNVDFEEAAALPLVGVSALQALKQQIGLRRGQKILIQGGAGGIGQVAVQIAKHLGAQVAVTVSTPDVAYARELGADVVIDYTKHRFEDEVQDYDAVFDTVGGEVFGRSLGVLKRGGVAVSMLGPVDEAKAKELGVTVGTQQTRVNPEVLGELRQLVEDGVVKIRIDSTYPLAEVREAFVKFENGARGKVLLRMA